MKCRNRYKKYLEEEYKRIVPIEDESYVPVVPEGLEEGLDTEEKPESQQESGEKVPESESEREKRKRKSIDDEWDRFHREHEDCLLYTSPSPRDGLLSRMPSSA